MGWEGVTCHLPPPTSPLQPRLVGKSSLPLQSLLRAGGGEVESVLGVHPADLSSAFSPTQPGQKKLGTLTVCSAWSSCVGHLGVVLVALVCVYVATVPLLVT